MSAAIASRVVQLRAAVLKGPRIKDISLAARNSHAVLCAEQIREHELGNRGEEEGAELR